MIARSREPILRARGPLRARGFLWWRRVHLRRARRRRPVRIYYGAADGVTAVADLSLAEILSGLA